MQCIDIHRDIYILYGYFYHKRPATANWFVWKYRFLPFSTLVFHRLPAIGSTVGWSHRMLRFDKSSQRRSDALKGVPFSRETRFRTMRNRDLHLNIWVNFVNMFKFHRIFTKLAIFLRKGIVQNFQGMFPRCFFFNGMFPGQGDGRCGAASWKVMSDSRLKKVANGGENPMRHQ